MTNLIRPCQVESHWGLLPRGTSIRSLRCSNPGGECSPQRATQGHKADAARFIGKAKTETIIGKKERSPGGGRTISVSGCTPSKRNRSPILKMGRRGVNYAKQGEKKIRNHLTEGRNYTRFEGEKTHNLPSTRAALAKSSQTSIVAEERARQVDAFKNQGGLTQRETGALGGRGVARCRRLLPPRKKALLYVVVAKRGTRDLGGGGKLLQERSFQSPETSRECDVRDKTLLKGRESPAAERF